MPPLVLALDASTPMAVVALVRDRVLSERATRIPTGAGGRLLGDVEAVLQDHGLAPADLDLIAVGVGPGSFTGIRAAMATARALGWASGVPVEGVVSLEAIAWSAGRGVIAPVIDARKGEVYGALYRVAGAVEVLVPPRVGTAEAVRDAILAAGVEALLVGDGSRGPAFAGVRPLTPGPVALDEPRGAAIAALAVAQIALRGTRPLAEIRPVYLRRSEAEIAIGPPTGGTVVEARTAG
ncbi:MAG: tRNA (adenosine(37)-N6)-threonylcarbamoyltransferase complex dimerization subunit type 1 TsaB [Myxococcales bacterium]